MSEDPFGIPGARLLQGAGSKGRGNVILSVGEGSERAILKIFRRRSHALLELFGDCFSRLVHGKTGFSVRCRYATEIRTHALWERRGIPVLKRLDRPLPAGVGSRAIWYEWLSCRRLSDVVGDPAVAWEEKERLLGLLGSSVSRRHDLAIGEKNPLYMHEHAALKHFFVDGDRLVGFDFEGGFGGRYAPREAMADELSGMLRSIARAEGERSEEAFRAFARGYGDKERLRAVAEWASGGGGIRRRLKRLRDFFVRDPYSKTAVLRQLATIIHE